MTRLSSNDLALLLAYVRDLYAPRSPGALSEHLCATIGRLIPAENGTYSELDPAGHRTVVELMNPPGLMTPTIAAAFCRHMSEHPLIAHYARTGDGHARKVSDFLSARQLHRLGLYNEYVRPYFGLEYQMAVAMTATPTRVVGMTVARSRRDFSERDRRVFDLIRPHVVQARRTAEATERVAAELAGFRRGLDSAEVGLIMVGPDGRVVTVTAAARTWLRQYTGERVSTALPDVVRRWLAAIDGGRRPAREVPPAREPLVLAREGHDLTLRMVPHAGGCLLLLEERATTIDHAALHALGLTRREAEVLVWVAAGKTNAETAAILGARPRTIEKHLERIYLKLGVENRTAAASVVGRARPR